MPVNLVKGQKIDLTKGNSSLRTVVVGLGWDAVPQSQKSGGWLSGLFGKAPRDIDCDASAILCGVNGKLQHKDDVVYYGSLQHSSGSVRHSGDNLTGEGAAQADDEQIVVQLSSVPHKYEKIVFVVNI
jgi:stress response protein SCP2